MLIILEGPDGAGKSTFADELRKHIQTVDYPVWMLHAGPIKKHPLNEYVWPLLDYTPGRKYHAICDRWHIGELVYGPLLRGESKLTQPLYRYISMFLRSRGAVIVHCTDSIATLQERLGARGDDLIKVENVPEIVQSYDDIFATWETALTYIFGSPYSNTVDEIIAEARHAEQAIGGRFFEVIPTYVGDPSHARLILVGDTRNGDPEWPSAFVPFESTSGHYLMRALDAVHQPHDEVGLFNACDELADGLEGAWKMLRARRPDVRFVALGNNAHRAMLEAGLSHGAVPHPQYWRRFHHANVERYGQLIREAATTQEDLRSCR